jgi:hypothetical protein
MAKRPHKKLDAWLKAIELTVETYRQTEKLPGMKNLDLSLKCAGQQSQLPAT